MRKKILVDIYLAFNLGDDMFLDHLAKQFNNYDFVPFHPGSNYDSFFKTRTNIKKFHYTILDKIKAKLGSNKLKDYKWMGDTFDGLLFLGGGIFREENYWREVYDYRLEILMSFKQKNKPVWYAGCNFGPYTSELFKESYKTLFSQLNQITFRDQTSYQLFSSLHNVKYAPDLLWSYQLPQVEKNEKHLGISVIDPLRKSSTAENREKYIKTHQVVIEKYKKEGYRVSLFAFCGAEGDIAIAKEILTGNQNAELVIYEGEIESYLKKIGSCSHFIAARFHASIIAMKFNQYLIPIIYEDKTQFLLDDLDESGITLNEIDKMKNYSFIKVDCLKFKKLEEESIKHLDFLI